MSEAISVVFLLSLHSHYLDEKLARMINGTGFFLKKKYIGARGFSITPIMLMKNKQEWKSKMD